MAERNESLATSQPIRSFLAVWLVQGKGTVFSVHAIKAYRGSRRRTPLILNLDARWEEVVTSSLGRFTTGKGPHTAQLDGLQNGKISFPYRNPNPEPSNPQSSRFGPKNCRNMAQAVAVSSSWWPGPVHVGFVVNKAALGQVLLGLPVSIITQVPHTQTQERNMGTFQWDR